MCQNCNNSRCGGCYQYCPPFPPTPGPQGPQGPPGPAGSSGTTSEVGALSRLIAFGSGNSVISTNKEVIMLFITATELVPGVAGSIGTTTAVQNTCIAISGAGVSSIDSNNSIKVLVGGNGFTGIVTAIASNSFNIQWTMVGTGLDVTVKWQAIVKA